MPSILNIALKLFKNNAAIRTLAAKRASKVKSGSAITRFADAGRARKLSKADQKRAEDLEDIAEQRFSGSRNKGVSLTRLLTAIDRTRRKNAIRDKVTVTSIKKGKNGNTLMSRSLTYDKSGAKVKIRPHKHVVKQIPTPGERTDIPISKAKRISFWCDCFSGDSKVLTSEGWRTFYELAEPYVPGHYPLKYLVDGKLHEGTAPYYKGRQSVYRITLSNGETIDTTKNQKFIYHTKEKDVWRKLNKLKVGDRLLLDSPEVDLSNLVFNKEFYEAFFIGVLMGDGSLFSRGEPDLQLYKKDAQEIIDILALSDTIAKVIPLNTRNGLRVKFNNRAMELMRRYKYINKKSVDIKNQTQLMGYLSGLIVTDGSIHKSEVHIHGGDYLKNLYELLLQYGFTNSKINVSRFTGTETNYGEATKNMLMVSVFSKSISKMRLLLTQDKSEKVQKIIGKMLTTREVTAKIANISYLGQRDVYDITVPSVKRFIVNGGVIAHNCEDFNFRWEYALATRWGASQIINEGADQFPVATNPGLSLGCCKHGFVLLTLIKQRRL